MLDESMRTGSWHERARAIARARLDVSRAAQTREATARIGRQILLERRRRAEPAGDIPGVLGTPAATRSRRFLFILAGALIGALIVAFFLLSGSSGGTEGDARTPASVAGTVSSETFEVPLRLPGVTSPDYARPAPVPATQAPAAIAPASTARPAAPGAGGGGGAPIPARTIAPTPVPTALPTPARGVGSPVQPGFQRFQGLVLNKVTKAPLADVCISVGPRGCQPPPFTIRSDSGGVWSVDQPIGDGTLSFDIHFEMTGYDSAVIHYSGTTAVNQLATVMLQPR